MTLDITSKDFENGKFPDQEDQSKIDAITRLANQTDFTKHIMI